MNNNKAIPLSLEDKQLLHLNKWIDNLEETYISYNNFRGIQDYLKYLSNIECKIISDDIDEIIKCEKGIFEDKLNLNYKLIKFFTLFNLVVSYVKDSNIEYSNTCYNFNEFEWWYKDLKIIANKLSNIKSKFKEVFPNYIINYKKDFKNINDQNIQEKIELFFIKETNTSMKIDVQNELKSINIKRSLTLIISNLLSFVSEKESQANILEAYGEIENIFGKNKDNIKLSYPNLNEKDIKILKDCYELTKYISNEVVRHKNNYHGILTSPNIQYTIGILLSLMIIIDKKYKEINNG